MVSGGDGEADGADTGVEVKDCVGGDVTFDFGESHFVDGEIDLEKAIRRVGVGVAQDFIGKGREDRMGLMIFIEAAGDFTLLVTAK